MTYWIFEMANNHQGSVSHAKLIVDKFSQLAKKYGINAGIKLQFRHLDTFIHKDFQDSDLKYVKRFNETRLSDDQFKEIIDYIKESGLDTIATPFDERSVTLLDKFDIDYAKIASCSVDDWPLHNAVIASNRKNVIISTAGAQNSVISTVYHKYYNKNISFMHCVGEYPTPIEHSNLNRIKYLKNEFSDIKIGISTHENPEQMSIVPLAVAMGCELVEKHVGVETDEIKLNKYSCTPDDMEKVIKNVISVEKAMSGISESQHVALGSLKRGMYLKHDIKPGVNITLDDVYFSMPCQEGQMNASDVSELSAKSSHIEVLKAHDPVMKKMFDEGKDAIFKRLNDVISRISKDSNVAVRHGTQVEVSSHYGLNEIDKWGAMIITRVNREYCKKLIFMPKGQKHPNHSHEIKEEAFELLHGECKLILNGKEINMKKGVSYVINRGVSHSFEAKTDVVIEEVSTTHVKNDSYYSDFDIAEKSLDERKHYFIYNSNS